MHLFLPICWALASLLSSAAASDDTGLSASVTVWSWPLSSSSPQQLAAISYNPRGLQSKVSAYTPPEALQSGEDLVRVGLYDPKTAVWRGVVTSAASFDPANQHRIELHLDSKGDIFHVGFAAFAPPVDPKEEKRKAREERRKAKAAAEGKPLKEKKKTRKQIEKAEAEARAKEQPLVEIIMEKPGPSPILNKPVQLSADGKAPDQPEEKSFLQKYWWAIAIFLVIQLVSAGSGAGGESAKK